MPGARRASHHLPIARHDVTERAWLKHFIATVARTPIPVMAQAAE